MTDVEKGRDGEGEIHIISATAVIREGRTEHLAMCGYNVGDYTAASQIHPTGNYLTTSGPYWEMVTCEGCRETLIQHRK